MIEPLDRVWKVARKYDLDTGTVMRMVDGFRQVAHGEPLREASRQAARDLHLAMVLDQDKLSAFISDLAKVSRWPWW